MVKFKVKRIYEAPDEADGWRVLVDRLWPRGVSKEKAALDEWNKEVAPSVELREWFGHKPERFAEFSGRYEEELKDNGAVAELHNAAKEHKTVTLLYAAHDPKVNHAVVLQKFLEK